jgi:hypothetical protein
MRWSVMRALSQLDTRGPAARRGNRLRVAKCDRGCTVHHPADRSNLGKDLAWIAPARNRTQRAPRPACAIPRASSGTLAMPWRERRWTLMTRTKNLAMTEDGPMLSG